METNRRKFITASLTGAVAAAVPGVCQGTGNVTDMDTVYRMLDGICRKKVLRKEYFPTAVIIESLDLLRYKDSFLCRVRSNAGLYHEFKGNIKEVPLHCETSSLAISNGIIKVPSGAGSGIDIDPDWIKKYQVVTR